MVDVSFIFHKISVDAVSPISIVIMAEFPSSVQSRLKAEHVQDNIISWLYIRKFTSWSSICLKIAVVIKRGAKKRGGRGHKCLNVCYSGNLNNWSHHSHFLLWPPWSRLILLSSPIMFCLPDSRWILYLKRPFLQGRLSTQDSACAQWFYGTSIIFSAFISQRYDWRVLTMHSSQTYICGMDFPPILPCPWALR